MKVITWNVNNRYGVVSQQVQALEAREPHVVALRDVYRRLHGYDGQTQENGWSWRYRDHYTYRFDHLLASHALCPVQAQYLHPFRDLHLSDHAPLEVLFESANRQDVKLRIDYLDYSDYDDGDRQSFVHRIASERSNQFRWTTVDLAAPVCRSPALAWARCSGAGVFDSVIRVHPNIWGIPPAYCFD